MFKTVRDYLNAFAAVWNGIAANVTAHALLVAKITAIDLLVTRQEAGITGITVTKSQARTALEEAILVVANAAASLAAATGNAELLEQTDLSPTDLSSLSEQRIDDVAARVRGQADDYSESLGNYGITEVELTALDDALEAYETSKTRPDVARAGRSGMTATLAPLVTGTGDLLREQMDKLMARYKNTDAEFHAGYEAARVVIDLRGPGGGDDPDPEPEPDPVP